MILLNKNGSTKRLLPFNLFSFKYMSCQPQNTQCDRSLRQPVTRMLRKRRGKEAQGCLADGPQRQSSSELESSSWSDSSGTGKRRMAATPVSWLSCSPETCRLENTRTVPAFSFTLSTSRT